MKTINYKYNPPPKGRQVVFGIIVKKPKWIKYHEEILNTDETYENILPVGAITWIYSQHCYLDKNGCYKLRKTVKVLHFENNRHHINFDPECFEILHTSSQKIKK